MQKCDKKRDSCGQCLRAQITCPGYHDPKTLVFRDQTETVIQKSRKRGKPSIPAAITIPVEEQAKHMFISQYVFGSSPLLDYMPTFYPSGLKDVHLDETIRAVGLAFFSNEVFSPSVLQTARKKYGHALLLTNKALQSPQSVTKDTMLLTVLLLDLFENLVIKDEYSSLEPETKHIDGAIALIKLHRKDQFHNAIRLRMFQQLSTNFLIRCLQREVEVPSDFISLRTYAAKFVDTNDFKWRFSDLMIRYARLRSAIRVGDCSDVQVIQVAMQMDGELLDICTNMPPESNFSIANVSVPVQSANLLWEPVHVYPSHNIRRIWNTIRLARILLNEVIQEYNQRLFGTESSSPDLNPRIQGHGSLPTLQSLLADICASVPQHTERSMKHLTRTPSSRAGAHTLIFPLYIAASSPFCPNTMRDWILGRLRFIGSSLCIPQAIMVKEILEKRKRGNPWGVAAMLESLSS